MKNEDELERKFIIHPFKLLNHVDNNLTLTDELISQYYVSGNPETRFRFFYKNNYGIKLSKVGSLEKRLEFDKSKITKIQFIDNSSSRIGDILYKNRITFMLDNGLTVELDIYLDQYFGLLIAEVEFDTQKEFDCFVPPNWFGKEVTNNPNFKNFALATKGFSLDELLDLIDQEKYHLF